MELKFGHRVLAGDTNIVCGISTPLLDKGKYLSPGDNGHYVLSDNDQTPCWYRHVKLDPDATEFLPGDEVEFSDTGLSWHLRKYKRVGSANGHYDEKMKHWIYCRYPRGGGGGKYSLNGKTAIIDGKEYELRLK